MCQVLLHKDSLCFSFPGTKKDINSYGSAAPAASNGDADEDDFDLFGSDDEEEVEKEKQKRLQQYAEKKAKSRNIHFVC